MNRLPLAELHVHLEGAADRDFLDRIAREVGWPTDDPVFRDGPARAWGTFDEFLDAYDDAARVFRTADSYRLLARWYLSALAAQGAIYAELTVSPQHAAANGLDLEALLEGVAEGMREAQRDDGIVARVIVTALRHRPPADALALAQRVVALRHPIVTGFGLAGDERIMASDFGEAFAVAAEGGLGCTVHAGELRGADSVWDALTLPVTRIGHGVRAMEDDDLIAELRTREITLECCPSSNVALGVVRSWADHPLRRMLAAGLRVTLNTDDPPYFSCTLSGEYEMARREQGLADGDLLRCTRCALEAAFLDEATRSELLSRCASVG